MPEEILNDAVDDLPTELELLKVRADDMNIGYHPNIGVTKLKAKIDQAMAPEKVEEVIKPKLVKANVKRMAHLREAKKLIRVMVINNNPTKKEWAGEYFGASNNAVGTIRRFVPFNIETHVENIIVNQLKARQMTRFHDAVNKKGQKVRKYRLVPEFSITVLDPLTPTELKKLAEDQAKRNAIDN